MADGTVETHPLKLDPLIVEKEGPDSSALHVLTVADGENTLRGMGVFFGCHATVRPTHPLYRRRMGGSVCMGGGVCMGGSV